MIRLIDQNKNELERPECLQWVKDRILESLYGNSLFSITGSFAIFLILLFSIWTQIQSALLAYWAFFGIFVGVARLALLSGFRHRKEQLTPKFWLNSYRFMSLCSGILNGLAMWLFFGDIPLEYQLLIYFAVAGLTAAASGTHAVDLPTFHLFMFSSCLLVITKLISHGGNTYIALSIMFIFYVLVMAKTGNNNNKTLLQNFKLTYIMHYRATHDPLLDLLNRTEFENSFNINIPLTRRGVSILFVDLDNFKPLNDTFGHQAGDLALKQVGDILKESLRSDDPIARIGGDEFVAYLFLDDVKEVERIARTIIQKINEISFPSYSNFTGLGASIGIAFHSNNNVKYSQLLHVADLACYKSKNNGKNQVTISHVNDDI